MNIPNGADHSERASLESLIARTQVDLTAPAEEDPGAERAQRLVQSLRRRWWFYLLVTIVAAGTGYFVSQEYGSYQYTAVVQVRGTTLPFPPGKTYYTPPLITELGQYLNHPEVLASLSVLGVNPDPVNPTKLIEDTYERRTNLVTVKVTRDTAAEAAAIANQVVSAAITKSTEDRRQSLGASLVYFNSLVGATEAEAASRRQAKIDRLNTLRTRFARDRGADLQFEELTTMVRQQRMRLNELELEWADANRMKDILAADTWALVSEVRRDVSEQVRGSLQAAAEQFAAESALGKDLEQKLRTLATLDEQQITTPSKLTDYLREVGQVVGDAPPLRPEHASALDRLNTEIDSLKRRLRLLPKKITAAKQTLTELSDQQAAVEMSSDVDLENIPEILELSAQIARAERNVEQMTSAIDWVKNMQALDTAAFEPLAVATPQSASAHGNHKKLLVLAFGVVGLVLGVPMLIFDASRSAATASEQLGRELGLETLATHAFSQDATAPATLDANDPELRLLALRIQRSARQGRGTVLLMSSLADQLSTNELATTIALCLVAREEKVLLIDLEPIEAHRRASSGEGLPVLVEDGEPAAGHSSQGQGANGHVATDDGNGYSWSTAPVAVQAAGSPRKVGLAWALASRGHEPEDVLVEPGGDGIDRLYLGEDELPVEAFASPLMPKLLDRYRNDYSIVLLSGPAAKHLADVQMLASRCDGTLFVAPVKGRFATEGRRTVIELLQSRVPIMGIAQVPT